MNGKTMKKSAARQIFTAMVAWILSFLLVLFTILAVLLCTAVNQKYMKDQVQKSGFVSLAMKQLNENYKSYGTVGNIPESVMTTIVTEERIEKDMERAVEGLYAGDRRLIAHPEVAQAVKQAVIENLQEREIPITAEIETAVNEMANGCQADYDSYVQLVIAPYLARFMPQLSRFILIGTAGLVVLSLVAVSIVFALQRRSKERLRWCIYSVLGASLFSVMIPLVFNHLVQMKYLNLNPQTLKALIVSYTHDAVNLFFVAAAVQAMIALVLAILWKCIAKRTTQKQKSTCNSFKRMV